MEGPSKRNILPSINKGHKLFEYIHTGNREDAKVLAEDPNCYVNCISHDGDDYVPLICASHKGYSDVVKVLLKRQDLEINRLDTNGWSALIAASYRRKLRCVKLLVDDRRIDVNLIGRDGWSALCWVYYNSYVFMIKLLILHGAKVEGVAETVVKSMNENERCSPTAEATKVMENWMLYLPKFTRIAKTNKYYPTEFKEWAINFILCCLKSRSFPKDIIYLLLEYIARAWKGTWLLLF